MYKHSVTKQCNSAHFPKPSSQRYYGTYGLFPESNGTSFADQLLQQLPSQGSISRGYCGAEFAGILPKEAPQAINDKLVVELNMRLKFYECRGILFVHGNSRMSVKKCMIHLTLQNLKKIL